MATDLRSKLDRTLPAPARDALEIAIDLAGRRDLMLALVGGAVRDLLLGETQIDVDLVVTPVPDHGSSLTIAIELADAVAEETGGRAVAHRRFGTATVRLPDGHLDMARARRERYRHPGALPEVASASLADDLARRDFTVNAMALRLNGDEAGSLVDPHGGEGDLRSKLIRTLHDGSFRDDATRILRAIRYAGRLGFELEAGTAASLDRDREYLATIGGARLRREIERTAVEERAGAIARSLAKHDVLAAIDLALRPGDRELRAATEISSLPVTHRDVVLLSVFVWRATPGDAERVVERLALTRRQATALRDVIALRDATPRLAATSRPSDVARLLDAYAPVAIESFALLTDDLVAAGCAREYLSAWRHVRPRLSGNDVEALGVVHGPAVGEALARLRAARLDGETASRDDEVALVSTLTQQAVGASRG